MNNRISFRKWRADGEHWVWLNAAAIAISLILVIGLLLLITVRGLAYFWPKDVVQVHYTKGDISKTLAGEKIETEKSLKNNKDVIQILFKIGNREHYGLDFKWLHEKTISTLEKPKNIAVIERLEWGNAYVFIQQFTWKEKTFSGNDIINLDYALNASMALQKKIHHIENNAINQVNKSLQNLEENAKKLRFKNSWNKQESVLYLAEKERLQAEYTQLNSNLQILRKKLKDIGTLSVETADGISASLPFEQVVRIYFPNDMSVLDKGLFYFTKIWEFVSEPPREANVEGGVFPAIFGTVIMVFLMTIFVTPFGVMAAIYLREYAKQGLIVRIIRISVNNLAGVPSIVYGVFGLGFFVYFIGGSIDSLVYPHLLPSPTFGSPGILWASLTLSLLTLPVVIVATEEGLSRIPSSIREGSLALGATKFETLMRTILPMTSPAIMTGLILAIARAAGEVAPLMLVGVVKLAPDLAVDNVAPYVHLDRQFMHLGFHIFDVGFQSPNVEAARPLVYATALLLVVIIVALNITAITIRNRLREKYKSLE